jgi:hypothetical protein
MAGTLGLGTISTRLGQVADLARRRPQVVITTLAHHIDMEWMVEAHRRTRKDGAVGVDSVTAEAYAADLQTNLERLLERFKAGTYVAPPVRRYHSEGDGEDPAVGAGLRTKSCSGGDGPGRSTSNFFLLVRLSAQSLGTRRGHLEAEHGRAAVGAGH